jgi:predicted RNA binding protein YcfA (HicA-like mRNA interferase family)
MGKRNNYSKSDFCKKGFAEKVARKNGCKVRTGRGSHAVVYSPDGTDQITIVRGRDIGKGLASSIWKKFVAWGVIIGAILLSCYVASLIQALP